MRNSVFVGWDPREAAAFAVAKHSIVSKCYDTPNFNLRGLVLDDLIHEGLHTRPLGRDASGKLIDLLSKREDYDGAISTEHANARFLVPFIAGSGWAMFCDGDILVRGDLNTIWADLDPQYAVYCVKHDYQPTETAKMDGQVQTRYARKNWSSVMIFNRDHPSNQKLTIDMVNSLPGRDLHAFCWLRDDEIGALDPAWNWLAGHSDPSIDPKLVHFTSGVPDMPGYHDVPYADEWRDARAEWAAWG